MALSAARRGDFWRQASRTSSTALSRSFTLDFPWRSEPLQISIEGSIAVIAGLNATGKSSALLSIASIKPESMPVVRLHELCEWVRRTLSERPDLVDAKAEYDPIELSDGELEAIRAVVGRNYESVDWFSIEIADGPFQEIIGSAVMPLMEVRYDGRPYSSQQMGLGELSVHILFWLLRHLQSSSPEVLLLDEPDAFLPDGASVILAGEVLSWARTLGSAVVISTHSHELALLAASHRSLHILTRQGGQLACLSGADAQESIKGMYSGPSRRPWVVVLVEDEAAYYLARAIWRRQSADLPPAEVIWLRGTGSIETLRKTIPSAARRFVFLYDGDRREDTVHSAGDGVAFLPSTLSPDDLLRATLSSHLEVLADKMQVSVHALQLRVESLESKNAHDWTGGLLDLAGDRALGFQALMSTLVGTLAPADLQLFKAEVASALGGTI